MADALLLLLDGKEGCLFHHTRSQIKRSLLLATIHRFRSTNTLHIIGDAWAAASDNVCHDSA